MSKEKEKHAVHGQPGADPAWKKVPGSATEPETAEMPETAGIPDMPETSSGAEEASAEKAAAVVEKLRLDLAEAEKHRLLALAEMDNQRKRAAKERETLRAQVEQETLMPFLRVFDHFSMGIRAAKESKDSKNVESLLKGMEIVQAEFEKAFSELGIEKIDDVGKEFDPNFHEAMMQESSDTVPAGRIIKQWSFGFRSGDRLIKPAMVIVSSGKPDSAAAEKTADPAAGEKAPAKD